MLMMTGGELESAMTLNITTLCIMALSALTLRIVILSIKVPSRMTIIIKDTAERRTTEWQSAEL